MFDSEIKHKTCVSFNDLQALLVYRTINGIIIDKTEDAWQWNKTRNVRELFKPLLPKR